MDLTKLSAQEDKPAPGPLVAVQAFANTLDIEEERDDRLGSPESLCEWLLGEGLADPALKVGDADVGDARRLREAIRAALRANAHGAPQDAAQMAAPGLELDAGVRLKSGEDGRLDLDLEPAGSVGEFLSQLLGISYRAQLLEQWQRLKLCENDECAWAFFDGSRNRSGSWCSMEVCGNRVKNREYRRRHAGD